MGSLASTAFAVSKRSRAADREPTSECGMEPEALLVSRRGRDAGSPSETVKYHDT